MSVTGKYAPLYRWLKSQPEDNQVVDLTFEQVEKILGESLPPSAWEHQSWWSNNSIGHVQAKAWLRAGWIQTEVHSTAKEVHFRRDDSARRMGFFAEVAQGLEERRPGTINKERQSKPSEFVISVNGHNYRTAVDSEEMVRVELHLDERDPEKTKYLYKFLEQRKSEIRGTLKGIYLEWSPPDIKISGHIRAPSPYNLFGNSAEIERAIVWAVETLFKFIECFEPEIEKIENQEA